MNYILIDLERSILTGVVHYWKSNRMGYTTDINLAGRYSEKEANLLVQEDFNQLTISISEQVLNQFSESKN